MATIPIPAVGTPTYQSWAQAVANKENSFAFANATITFTGGRGNVPASLFGLSVINGLVVIRGGASPMSLFNIASGLNTATVQLIGIGWAYTTAWASVPADVVGAVNLYMCAWSSLSSLGTLDQPEHLD